MSIVLNQQQTFFGHLAICGNLWQHFSKRKLPRKISRFFDMKVACEMISLKSRYLKFSRAFKTLKRLASLLWIGSFFRKRFCDHKSSSPLIAPLSTRTPKFVDVRRFSVVTLPHIYHRFIMAQCVQKFPIETRCRRCKLHMHCSLSLEFQTHRPAISKKKVLIFNIQPKCFWLFKMPYCHLLDSVNFTQASLIPRGPPNIRRGQLLGQLRQHKTRSSLVETLNSRGNLWSLHSIYYRLCTA